MLGESEFRVTCGCPGDLPQPPTCDVPLDQVRMTNKSIVFGVSTCAHDGYILKLCSIPVENIL